MTSAFRRLGRAGSAAILVFCACSGGSGCAKLVPSKKNASYALGLRKPWA